MLAAVPRPFADAGVFIALAAEIPLREWRDVLLLPYREMRRTPRDH